MRDQPDAGNMPSLARKGRGAVTNPPVRFDRQVISPFDDGWDTLNAEFGELPKLTTTLTRDATKSAIAWNSSPDIGFDRAVNPYRGCEHGCIYCYARPDARLSRLLARPGFRDQAGLQAGCGGAAGEGAAQGGIQSAHPGAGFEHRSVSAGRAHAEADALGAPGAGPVQSSGRHRDQIGGRVARSRHSELDGTAQAGACVCVCHHAGCGSRSPRWSRGLRRRSDGCTRSPN